MSLAELAELAKPTISKVREPVSTSGLWTSRSPVLLPPSPIPGQHNVPTPTFSSAPIFPRFEFGLCANESGDVYFYGGETEGRSDELYHYSIKNNTVTPLQCSGTGPGSIDGHAMTLVGNVIAIHGGWGVRRDPDLYLLNLVSRVWSKVATSGNAPGFLHRHGVAAVGTCIYVFGGSGHSRTESGKLWAFDLDTLRTAEPQWELVEPSSLVRPSPRYAATLVSYHDRLIVFGGFSKAGDLRDVWSFDLKSRAWSELHCTGNIPPPRVGHAAAVLDDVMYIIGGSEHLSTLEGTNLGDTFALKIPEQRWFRLRIMDTTPAPRYYLASVCIGTNIFIFGGKLRGETEEHGIHILNANYINNPNLHAPERLREIDIQFQVVRNEEKSGNTSPGTETSRRRRIVSHILQHPLKMESLAKLQRADAQMIVDFLADELGHRDILQSNTDKRHILHFLTKLAKSAQVFPKSTELSDVQCTLTTPVNIEGGYGFIYKGVLRGQVVCVKAVHIVGTRGGRMSRASKKSPGDKMSLADKTLRAQAGEAVLLAHVSHPNVIPLYGTYLSSEESPRICIVSPWMDNGDLDAYLRKFPDNPKIPLASDMAAGLGFLHDMDIIHADLKAKNVLVSRSHRAMLADFGIATVFHTNVGMTTSADFAGTTYWMAPELLAALAKGQRAPPTKGSDIWAFACICYEMFTGEIPFFDRDYMPQQLMMAFAGGRKITPLRPNEESDPIDADGDPISVDDEPWVPLAEKCWNYDSSERPTATEALHFLTDLNMPDDRPSMDEELATFKAIKDSRVSVEIDYPHVLSIIQNT